MASKVTTLVVSPCTEVVANDFSWAVEIYPNPSSEEINIRLKQDGNFIVTITDLTGRQQFRSRNFENREFVKMEVGDLPPGVYLLKVQSRERSGVYKLLIE
jgi:hypothetical protein